MIWENSIETCIITICEIDDQSKFDAWNWALKAGALGQPRGMGWGTHVHLWLLHVNVWQKPPRYCKVISLQLQKKKKNTGVGCHFLFQSIFLTQRLNLCLLLGKQILNYWATWTGFEMFQLGVTWQSSILRLWSCCPKCPWSSSLPSFSSFHPFLFLNVNNLNSNLT